MMQPDILSQLELLALEYPEVAALQERCERLEAVLTPFAEIYRDYKDWLASFQQQHSGRTIAAYLARGDVNNRRLNEAEFKAAADALEKAKRP